MRSDEFVAKLKARARELGFPVVGIAPIADPAHSVAFAEWLEHGYHGEMAYLLRTASQRRSLTGYLPWAKAAIVAVWPQGPGAQPTACPALPGTVARYAGGEDYHEEISSRLSRLLEWVRTAVGREVAGRICVDTSPVLERELAARAGVGWVGKNATLVVPELGSFACLGELFVDLELPPDSPIEDRCGACRACLEACPTQAFVSPRILDARRCISYWTTHARGAIPADLRVPMGLRVYGCDACQTVCPHNIGRREGDEPAVGSCRLQHEWTGEYPALSLTEGKFREAFRASPMRFVKRRGLLRNVCVVLGNSGYRGHTTALGHLLHDDPEPLVRGHAAWALGRIGGPEATACLEGAAGREGNAEVNREIRVALTALLRT